jgi:hypothetical protein
VIQGRERADPLDGIRAVDRHVNGVVTHTSGRHLGNQRKLLALEGIQFDIR